MSGVDVLSGLKISIQLASISLIFSLILGTFLLIGITSKLQSVRFLINGVIEIVYGIPLIAIIFIVHYGIPWFKPFVSSIIILSLIGMIDFAFWGRSIMREGDLDNNFITIMKVISIVTVREWSRLINYSALLSMIGVAELLRVSKVAMSVNANFLYIVIAVMIYVFIHIGCKIIESILKKSLFIGIKQQMF